LSESDISRFRSRAVSRRVVLASSAVWSASSGVVIAACAGPAVKSSALAGESTISMAWSLPRLRHGAKAVAHLDAACSPAGRR
jgi:hypothetical protein